MVDSYHTLLNPGRYIPPFISSFTGISNDMVADAPFFADAAADILAITEGQIFVAHSVNFDYHFVKKEFEEIGVPFDRRKLCTVRLSRQVFPGLPSYSLGNLCGSLGISIENRHRAHGDAEATVKVLQRILDSDKNNTVGQSLKRNSKEAYLPANLDKAAFARLPARPGIYYFHDSHGKVVYVGKAINIKSRVAGHFTGDSSREKRLFHNTVFDVSYQLCGNELVALLEEAKEIKRLWPRYNRSQKQPAVRYGIFQYIDRQGYIRLCVNKVPKGVKPEMNVATYQEGRSVLNELVKAYTLCPRLCGIQKCHGPCVDHALGRCKGACVADELAEVYNVRVEDALQSMYNGRDTLAIIGQGRDAGERSLVLVENGTYIGHGFIDYDLPAASFHQLKNHIKFHPEHQETRRILRAHLQKAGQDEILRFDHQEAL